MSHQIFRGLLQTAGGGGGGGGAGYSTQTFDPATKGSNITLSGGNLIATLTVGGTTSGARSTAGQTTGKQYFEASFGEGGGATNDGFLAAGVSLAGASYVTLGNVTTGGALAFRSGVYINSGSAVDNPFGAISNFQNPLCVAVDYTNSRIWFRSNHTSNWNGNATYNPATNVGGYDFSAIATGTLYPTVIFRNVNVVCTINFGASAFAGVVPSGFN